MSLLETNVEKRLSAEDALKHPWITIKGTASPMDSQTGICCKSHKDVSPEKIYDKLELLKTCAPKSRLK